MKKTLLALALAVCLLLGLSTVAGAIGEGENILAQVHKGGQLVESYNTFAQAAEAAAECGGIVKLTRNVAEEATVQGDLWVDLNGFSLSGITVTGTVYGMDSTTNDYTAEKAGSLSLAGGKVAVSVKTTTANAGAVRRYLAVEEEGVYSFHRFYFGITHITMEAKTAGIGYRATFAGSEAVKGYLDSFGLIASVSGVPADLEDGVLAAFAAADYAEEGKLVTKRVLIRNILEEGLSQQELAERAKTVISAVSFLQTKQGDVILSTGQENVFQAMVEAIDVNFYDYAEKQQTQLQNFYQKFEDTMQTWALPHLHHNERTHEDAVALDQESVLALLDANVYGSSATLRVLPAGSYYLTEDINIGKRSIRIEADTEVSICLGGRTLISDCDMFRIYGTLNVHDCCDALPETKRGRLVSNSASDFAHIFYAFAGSEFNLYGGDLTTTTGAKQAAVGIISHDSTDASLPAAVMNMYGGHIYGGRVTGGGGALGVYQNATFNMYGGEIYDNKAGTGGAINLNVGTILLQGGHIRDNSADGNGGNIYAAGRLEVHEGTVIEKGNSAKYGGNIYLVGEMIMDGGLITDGVCVSNGGNISTSGAASVVLSGGQITNGWGQNVTGNIHVLGEMTMTGGTVTGGKSGKAGNTAANHADLQLVDATLNQSGGVLGRVQATNSTKTGCAVNLSGKARIQQLYMSTWDSNTSDSFVPTAPFVTVAGAMDAEARVEYLTGGGAVFAYGADYTVTEADGKAFYLTGRDVTAKVDAAENALYFDRVTCLCDKQTHTKACLELWGGEARYWTPWTSTTTLPVESGNYYLLNNVTLTSGVQNLKTNANVVLDLYGKTVTGKANNRMYATFNTGSSLTISDSSAGQTGKMVGTGTNFIGKSCCIWLRYGTFNLVGGTLDGSAAIVHNGWENSALAEKNGGVLAMEPYSIANIYGGIIIGAKATATTVDGNAIYAPMGASIYIPANATVNMYNGTVKNGNTEKNGGNIYIKGGTLNLYGGTITGGEAKDSGGNVFNNGGTIHMSGGVIKNGTRNGVSANLNANCSFINNGVLNISGGEIHGRLSTGSAVLSADKKTGTVNVSGSAKIYTPTAAAPVVNNNISVTLTVNIGKLSSDAQVGLIVSASLSNPLTSDSANPRQLANVQDPESVQAALESGRLGLHVYIANDTYVRSYALLIKDGKLCGYQTAPIEIPRKEMPPMGSQMRHMSFNILGTAEFPGFDNEEKRNNIKAIIQEIDPDTFGVQEAGKAWTDGLVDLLEGEYAMAAGHSDPKVETPANWTNALYYKKDKFTYLDSGMYYLNGDGSYIAGKATNNCCFVLLERKEDGALILLLNVHLNWLPLGSADLREANIEGYGVDTADTNFLRMDQVVWTAEIAKERVATYEAQYGKHVTVLLGGDFNINSLHTAPHNKDYETTTLKLASYGLLESGPIAKELVTNQDIAKWVTYRRGTAANRLDYIYISDSVRPETFTIHNLEQKWEVSSDHMPVYLDYYITQPAGSNEAG